MPIRAQETLFRWEIDLDGGIQAMVQVDPSTGGIHTIPIDKALLFRTVTTKNNPEGRSILRNAYRPWFFKRRIEEIEAIGIERDLAGLPVAYLPPEYLSSSASAEQQAVLASIQSIVTSIKRNEQEGIVMPAMYDDAGHKMFDLQLLSSGGSRQFDTDKIINRYDQRMSMSILSDFILLGSDRVGSYALGASKMDLWSMAVDSIAKNIAEVMNRSTALTCASDAPVVLCNWDASLRCDCSSSAAARAAAVAAPATAVIAPAATKATLCTTSNAPPIALPTV